MKAKKNNNKTQKQADETINICKVKPRYITLNEDIFQSLSPHTLKLYLAMRYESDYSIECSSIKKNIKFLENKTNLSRRQILYSLKELEGFGLVKRERESGYQSTYWTAQDMGYFLPAIEEKKDPNDGKKNEQPSQDMHGVVHNMHEGVQDMHGVVHNMHDIINNIFINLFKYIYIPDSGESGKNEKIFSNFQNEDREVIIENQSLIEKEKSDYFDNHKKNKPVNPNYKHLGKDKTKIHQAKNKDYSRDERFMRFYTEYPRKVDPHDAYKAFKSIVGDDDLLLEQIVKDIKQRKQHHEQWKDKKYIKYPAAYLRKGEYLSEMFDEKAELEEKRRLLNLEHEKRMKAQEEASRKKEAQDRENKNRFGRQLRITNAPQKTHYGLKTMLGW